MAQSKGWGERALCKPFRLQVPTDIEALNDVLHWFEAEITPFLPRRCGWESKLALAEGFTNTVCYAHRDLPSITPIDIEIEICDRQIYMKIWDFGDPFDMMAKLKSIQTSQQDPLAKENERGLFLMNALTTELQYLRIADRNCLIMRKEF